MLARDGVECADVFDVIYGTEKSTQLRQACSWKKRSLATAAAGIMGTKQDCFLKGFKSLIP